MSTAVLSIKRRDYVDVTLLFSTLGVLSTESALRLFVAAAARGTTLERYGRPMPRLGGTARRPISTRLMTLGPMNWAGANAAADTKGTAAARRR